MSHAHVKPGGEISMSVGNVPDAAGEMPRGEMNGTGSDANGALTAGEMPRGEMNATGSAASGALTAGEMPRAAVKSENAGEPAAIEIPGSWRLVLVPAR